MTTTTKTPNQLAREAIGTTPPYTLAQTEAWAERCARLAREAAARWVEGCRRHRTYAREAERFDAVVEELRRLHSLVAEAG